MPGYKAHVSFAALLYALVLASSGFLLKKKMILTFYKALEWFVFITIGALFPDVDIKSKGQILFYECTLALLLFLWWKSYTYLFVIVAFLALLPLVVRHRGLFHRPWFVVVIMPLLFAFILSYFYPKSLSMIYADASFFSIGALSHCFLDAFVTRFTKKRW